MNILLENLDNERFHELTCFYAALGNADPLISVILDNPGLKKLQLANRCKNEALLNYLANERWREADNETAKMMLQVSGRTAKGYLDYDDIQQFPCEDLRIIDRLWVKYSGGHFGFSVQKKIWLKCSGKVDYET